MVKRILQEEWKLYEGENPEEAFDIETARRPVATIHGSISESDEDYVSEEDRLIGRLIIHSPKLFLVLKKTFALIEHHKELKHRTDLFNATEKDEIRALIQAIEDCPTG